ncbi:MAG: sensor histidine kinase [Velocimicrobium sp.]
MIKKLLNAFLEYKIWFIILAVLNVLFGVFLWLMDVERFTGIFGAFILGSLGLYCVSAFFVYKIESKKVNAIMDLLENPDLDQEEITVSFVTGREKDEIRVIGRKLREKDQKIRNQNLNILEYEEYIETWAHEIKTPLALMTFVLDNRKEEISPTVYHRLEYARTQMQEDIERMLYYARLKSAHTDYLFEKMSLRECCHDVLDEYGVLLQERKINIMDEVENLQIISDKKGLNFLISQIISNSIKYMKSEKSEPFVYLFTDVEKKSGDVILGIRDNGIGVKSYDIPFLFDKGFTGDTGDQRKKSTGMGLYLANQIADNLKIRIEVSEEYKDGFEILFRFPSSYENTTKW